VLALLFGKLVTALGDNGNILLLIDKAHSDQSFLNLLLEASTKVSN